MKLVFKKAKTIIKKLIKNEFRISMFITSFVPLWISIIFINLWSILAYTVKKIEYNFSYKLLTLNNFKKLFNHFLVEIIFSIFILVILIYCIFHIKNKIYQIDNSENKEFCLINKAVRANKLGADFLLAYILPMFVFNFGQLRDLGLFFIFFFTLGFLCIRNDNVYINIFLEVLGYKMYTVSLKQKKGASYEEYEDVLFLSKQNLINSRGHHIECYDFNNQMYIKLEGEKVSKINIKKALNLAKTKENYAWTLYLFSINKKGSGNPFRVKKMKFKDQNYLKNYGVKLVGCISTYQIDPIEKVEEYHGENPKISCDKIDINSELIKKYWDYLMTAVTSADEDIEGKIKGYILIANPNPDQEDLKDIIFIKKANPIIEVKDDKAIAFKMDEESNLIDFSTETYRFYLNADCIILDNALYTFTLGFEELFSLDKTYSKIKKRIINDLTEKNLFSCSEKATSQLNSLNSRSFVKIFCERVEKISDSEEREKIAEDLNINLDSEEKFILDSKDKASRLIKFLQCKSIKEEGSGQIFEISGGAIPVTYS